MSFIDKITGREPARPQEGQQAAQADQPQSPLQDVANTNEGASDSSAEKKATVPEENRFAEIARKMSKQDKNITQMNSSMQQLIDNITKLTQSQTTKTNESDQTADDDQEYNLSADPRVTSIQEDVSHFKQSVANDKYEQQFEEAKDIYPGLNQEADDYDEKFFTLADQYFKKFSQLGEKNAVTDAVQLAAAKLGKFQELEKEKLLKDNIRRSRLIGEGGMQSANKEEKTEPDVPDSVKALASRLPSLSKLDNNQLKNLMKMGAK